MDPQRLQRQIAPVSWCRARVLPAARRARMASLCLLLATGPGACASAGGPQIEGVPPLTQTPTPKDTPAPVGSPEPAGPTYHLGGGAGIFVGNDGGGRFGNTYGRAFPAVTFDFETRFPSGWLVSAAGEYGSASGREELVTGRESETSLSLFPAHFTVGRLFPLEAEWQLAVGGGATISTYREVNELVASDGTRVGGHALASIRWQQNRWSLNGTFRYSYVPDGLEERSGGADVVDRHSLGFATLAFTAQYQIWPHGSPTEAGQSGPEGQAGLERQPGQVGQTATSWAADRGRFQVQIYGTGIFPTGDYRQAVTRVRYRSVQFRSSLGVGAGFRARLTGPIGVGLEATFSRPGWHATAEFPGARTVFHADGEMDQKTIALGLDLHFLEHETFDLYVIPLVSYLSYEGEAAGEYTATVDRDGYGFGLGVGADIGRGRWVFNGSFKHLSVARISGFESGFNARPILLTFGLGFRF